MIQFTYTITSPVGIHARPAGLLVETVKGLSSAVTITKGDRSAPADRLLALLLLEICKGDLISVTLVGPTEERDAQILKEFFHAHL